MKKIFIFWLMITFIVILFADTNEEYGFQILKINSGADAIARAGAGTVNSGDAFAFLQNPIAALFAPYKAISISQNYWIFDTILNSGAYVNPKGKSSFAFSYRYLDYGKIDNRDDVGMVIGEYHPMDLIMTTNFGLRLTPNHFLAINLHGLYQKIDTSSSLGFAADLGYLYKTPIKNLSISGALKNLGSTSKMNEEKIKLPISGIFGFSYQKRWQKFDFSLGQDFTKNIDDEDIKAASGLKVTYNNILALKTGYKFNYDAENVSFGFGLNLKKITFDYAFLPLQEGIEDTHIFQLTYKFR